MRTGKWLHRLGSVALATVALGICARVLLRESSRVVEDGVTIRFAHRLLDDPVREAFHAVAREFERQQAARGRKVRVEQVDIPDRSYRQWMRTQLIGGTAPELMLVETNGFEDELLARYFTSLAEAVEAPNPYNDGTSQAGVKWRDTILDGMQVSGFNFRIVDYFGVPICAHSTRIFVNRNLLQQILDEPDNTALKKALGAGLVPRTFEDFMMLCEATRVYAERRQLPLSAIVETSSSSHHSLLDLLMGSQTQKIEMSDWDMERAHRVLAGSSLAAIVAGRRSINHPAYRSGFALMREVGQYMPPWFFQLQREDVAFLYATERALMIAGRSNDEALFRAFIGDRFEQMAFRLPTPSPTTKTYGEFALGQLFEARDNLTECLGVVNFHPPERRALALEFLQFLTSVPGNALFSRVSGRLPSAVDVPVRPELEVFLPLTTGYSRGPDPHFNLQDFRRVLDRHYHLLFDRHGGVDAFFDGVEEPFQAAALPELRRYIRNTRKNAARQDSLIAAQRWLILKDESRAPAARRKLDLLIDGQGFAEDEWLFYGDMLAPVADEVGL